MPLLHFFESVSDDRHGCKPAWKSTVNALTLKVTFRVQGLEADPL